MATTRKVDLNVNSVIYSALNDIANKQGYDLDEWLSEIALPQLYKMISLHESLRLDSVNNP